MNFSNIIERETAKLLINVKRLLFKFNRLCYLYLNVIKNAYSSWIRTVCELTWKSTIFSNVISTYSRVIRYYLYRKLSFDGAYYQVRVAFDRKNYPNSSVVGPKLRSFFFKSARKRTPNRRNANDFDDGFVVSLIICTVLNAFSGTARRFKLQTSRPSEKPTNSRFTLPKCGGNNFKMSSFPERQSTGNRICALPFRFVYRLFHSYSPRTNKMLPHVRLQNNVDSVSSARRYTARKRSRLA